MDIRKITYLISIMLITFNFLGCEDIKYELEPVHFIEGSTMIIKKDKKTLYANLKVISENINFYIEIAGYTCSTGSISANLQLSEDRALFVKNWFISNGIDDSRLNTVGYGESDPLMPNDSPENRALNDRVEFIIVE